MVEIGIEEEEQLGRGLVREHVDGDPVVDAGRLDVDLVMGLVALQFGFDRVTPQDAIARNAVALSRLGRPRLGLPRLFRLWSRRLVLRLLLLAGHALHPFGKEGRALRRSVRRRWPGIVTRLEQELDLAAKRPAGGFPV